MYHSWVLFLLMAAFITVEQTKATFCGECELTKLPSFDDLQVTHSPLWTKQSPHEFVCARLCLMDHRCVSFNFRDADFTCRGYPLTFSSAPLTSTTPSSGTKLFHTCQGDNQYGAPCSQTSECSPQHVECDQGVCTCQTGYEFSDITIGCEVVTTTTTTTTTTTSVPTTVTTTSSFTIPGCYEDRNDARILPHYQDQLAWYTTNNDDCAAACLGKGYALAGTEDGSQCFCGDTIPDGYGLFDDSECSKNCAGNSLQKCGGVNRISVFWSL